MEIAPQGSLRISAAVNLATCTVHQGQLSKAIEVDRSDRLLSMILSLTFLSFHLTYVNLQVSERIIREDPLNNLDVALCFNLCMMYDLENEQSSGPKKAVLAQLVKQYAADDFDISMINGGRS